MAKGFLSILVVFGVLYSIHISGPNATTPNIAALTEALYQKEEVAEPASFDAVDKESPKASMKIPVERDEAITHTEEAQSEDFAQEWVSATRGIEKPLTKVETPELELIPPPQPEPKALTVTNESPEEQPQQLSGTLVMNNTPAESAPVSGNAALPSELTGASANIYFAFDSYELSKSGEESLTKLAATLISDQGVTVEIAGHTDSVGDPEVNEAFSSARAQAVFNKLSSLGVPRDRMKITSFGKTKPSESNASAKGRSANRRVEVAIIRN